MADSPDQNIANAHPSEVKGMEARMRTRGMTPIIEKNFGEAKGSDDAAGRRRYLERQGVPKPYELSSYLFQYFDVDQVGQLQKHYVMAMCRGSDRILSRKIEKYLGVTLSQVIGPEDFGHDIRGLVNPCMAELEGKEVRYLWDKNVSEGRNPAVGVFTNAGHREWGMQFWPEDHPSFKPENVGDFVDEKLVQPWPRKAKVAILTGDPHDAGELFRDLLIRRINTVISDGKKESFGSKDPQASLAKLVEPDVALLSSSDSDLSMYQGLVPEKVKKLLLGKVEEACRIPGVELLVVPNNTLSTFATEICEMCDRYGVQYISMQDALAEHLENIKPKSIIFCTMEYVASAVTSAYRHIFPLYKNISLLPNEMSDLRAYANEFKVKSSDRNSGQKFLNFVNRVMKRLAGGEVMQPGEASDKPVVVAALTEISLGLFAYKQSGGKMDDMGVTIVDTLETYAKKVGDVYCALAFSYAPHRKERMNPVPTYGIGEPT